jgi:beta-lactamase class A
VGKDYAGKQAHRRDPLHGLSHGATAYQVARIYYHLYRGTLLDEKHTVMMREMMSKPGISHKFVRGLAQEPDLELWRKSGTWKNFHADGGVVFHRKRGYIIVGIIEHPEGGEGLSELVVLVDELMEKMK